MKQQDRFLKKIATLSLFYCTILHGSYNSFFEATEQPYTYCLPEENTLRDLSLGLLHLGVVCTTAKTAHMFCKKLSEYHYLINFLGTASSYMLHLKFFRNHAFQAGMHAESFIDSVSTPSDEKAIALALLAGILVGKNATNVCFNSIPLLTGFGIVEPEIAVENLKKFAFSLEKYFLTRDILTTATQSNNANSAIYPYFDISQTIAFFIALIARIYLEKKATEIDQNARKRSITLLPLSATNTIKEPLCYFCRESLTESTEEMGPCIEVPLSCECTVQKQMHQKCLEAKVTLLQEEQQLMCDLCTKKPIILPEVPLSFSDNATMTALSFLQ